MQNLQEAEFNRFIYQNLARYVPEDFVNNLPTAPQREHSIGSKLSSFFFNVRKPELVNKLWPMTVVIGMCEVLIGLGLMSYVGMFSEEYDTIFNTEDTKCISYLTVFGCACLIVTGLVLLFALVFDHQESIRVHILMSVLFCVYIFVLACLKIHLSFLVIERDAAKMIQQASQDTIVMSLGFVIGSATLLGSVIYFIATVTVFTYYNLKYVQPY